MNLQSALCTSGVLAPTRSVEGFGARLPTKITTRNITEERNLAQNLNEHHHKMRGNWLKACDRCESRE